MKTPRSKNTHPTTQAVSTPLKDIQKKVPLRVLSQQDWNHWTTFGYVVVPQAVPEKNVKRLAFGINY